MYPLTLEGLDRRCGSWCGELFASSEQTQTARPRRAVLFERRHGLAARGAGEAAARAAARTGCCIEVRTGDRRIQSRAAGGRTAWRNLARSRGRTARPCPGHPCVRCSVVPAVDGLVCIVPAADGLVPMVPDADGFGLVGDVVAPEPLMLPEPLMPAEPLLVPDDAPAEPAAPPLAPPPAPPPWASASPVLPARRIAAIIDSECRVCRIANSSILFRSSAYRGQRTLALRCSSGTMIGERRCRRRNAACECAAPCNKT